ncbi:MAG: hypothetical protein EON60_13540 [Alphaproteobacteria bacterium]|nr:MAG: hypothetical protein EON60_13540 [Alphaproteobacteria bacterium]
MLKGFLGWLKEIRTARETLYDEGYRAAGKAVPLVDENNRRVLAGSPYTTETNYIGNIMRGCDRDAEGVFAIDTADKVPPRWKHPAFLRGYHARLQDELQTKFVRIDLMPGELPRACIEIRVHGAGRASAERDNVVKLRSVNNALSGNRREV